MSVLQACAMVEAAVHRARSLFAAEPAAPTSPARGNVATAAQSTAAAAQLTVDMSGALIARHKTFAEQNAPRLAGAAQTDAALHAHVTTAATVTHTGAQQLDAIAAQTRATSQPPRPPQRPRRSGSS